jgi:hypothetical protein
MNSLNSLIAGVAERFFEMQCNAGIHSYRYDRVLYNEVGVTKKHCMECGDTSFENPTIRD